MAANGSGRPATGVSLWGFALFLAVNATSVWGGVFPFLPMEFQTVLVTLSFYGAQAGAATCMYVVSLICSFLCPARTARRLGFWAAPPMIAGSLALIAAMYVHSSVAIALVICAGVLLGIGSTSMSLLWQRTFSSYADDAGDVLLVVGTGLSALIYFALYLCPVAVTAYLVPLVFLPLCAASLTVSARSIDLNQPMFADQPREHPHVYRRFAHDYWRSSISAGAVGFVAGIMRAVALGDVTAGHVVNVTSMLGALLSAAAILVLWRRFSFHLSMRKAYRWAFPTLTLALVLIPFAGGIAYLDVFAGAVYSAFAFVQMVLLVQCAQASRDRGVCPVVTYAFCSGIMHAMHFLGFLCGWGTGLADGLGPMQLALAALLGVWVLGLVLFLIWMRPGSAADAHAEMGTGFQATVGVGADAGAGPGGRGDAGRRLAAHGSDAVTFVALGRAAENARRKVASRPVLDRLTKQCETLRIVFRLSDREAEVMELIARGDTVARIANTLSVSENTVRTHAKRIYTKLGIHSKQELGDLLRQFEPTEL